MRRAPLCAGSFFYVANATNVTHVSLRYGMMQAGIAVRLFPGAVFLSPAPDLFEGESMPYRPKRPCSFPGCPNLTDGRFCEAHRKIEAQRYNRYERDPEINRRYDARWRRVRDAYIRAHPLCERCLEEGRMTPARHVHHVLPLSQGGTHDWDNLRALCLACHSKTEMEQGGLLRKKEGRGEENL